MHNSDPLNLVCEINNLSAPDQLIGAINGPLFFRYPLYAPDRYAYLYVVKYSLHGFRFAEKGVK